VNALDDLYLKRMRVRCGFAVLSRLRARRSARCSTTAGGQPHDARAVPARRRGTTVDSVFGALRSISTRVGVTGGDRDRLLLTRSTWRNPEACRHAPNCAYTDQSGGSESCVRHTAKSNRDCCLMPGHAPCRAARAASSAGSHTGATGHCTRTRRAPRATRRARPTALGHARN